MVWFEGDDVIAKGDKILAVNQELKIVEEKWDIIHDHRGQTWEKGEKSSAGFFTLTSKQYGLLLTANTSDLEIKGIVSIFLLETNYA